MIGSVVTDGLDALRVELSLPEIMRLIEQTARWVAVETFQYLPVWYPEHSRRALFYKSNWSEPQLNTNRQTGQSVHKAEGNRYANKALTHALGLRSKHRPNWSCCHVWGVDDATYASTNLVIQDRRFYSCVANMVLLPTPLKAFTDVMPEVKHMLRACAFHTYAWRCEIEGLANIDPASAIADAAYPTSWPRRPSDAAPPGTVAFGQTIKADADRRKAAIRRDLELAGPFYPRDEVRKTLRYWNIEL